MILKNPFGKMAGFFDLDGNIVTSYFVQYYTGYVFVGLVFLIFVMASNFLNQYIAQRLEEKDLQKAIIDFLITSESVIASHKAKSDVEGYENTPDYLEEIYFKSEQRRLTEMMEITGSVFLQSLRHSANQFRNFFTYQLQRSVLYLLLIALICVVLSVPSLCSLPYLLFMYLGLLLSPGKRLQPNKVLLYGLPIIYVYSMLYLTAQYIFQFPGFSADVPKTTDPSDSGFNPSGNGGILFYPVEGILFRTVVGTTVGAFLMEVSVNGRSIALVAVIFAQLVLSLFLSLTLRVSLFTKVIVKENDNTAQKEPSSKPMGNTTSNNVAISGKYCGIQVNL